MKTLKRSGIILALVLTGLTPAMSCAQDIQSCGSSSAKTEKTYKVTGSDISVRKGPGANFDKIINQKATSILKTTHYIRIDNPVTVLEECAQGGWSKIAVTDPDYLNQSHRGWVESKVLRGKKVDSSGMEVFTEVDFIFDKTTRPYKNIIIAGVNKIHRENQRCKNIDPASAYKSGSKGTYSNPVFFVTCGEGYNVFNVFFSKSDVEE